MKHFILVSLQPASPTMYLNAISYTKAVITAIVDKIGFTFNFCKVLPHAERNLSLNKTFSI